MSNRLPCITKRRRTRRHTKSLLYLCCFVAFVCSRYTGLRIGYAASARGPREHSESSSGAARASGGGAPRAVENVRWQWLLPFEPVNKPRLERLKAERAVARATIHVDAGRYADKRRQAQIAARHALDAIAAGLDLGQLAPTERDRLMNGAIHAAELQLPESWLSFVVAR